MLLVYGYGAMTGAMVAGWLRAGRAPGELILYNPRPKPAPEGVALVTTPPAAPFPLVVLGFKPALLGDLAPRMTGVVGAETMVVSVLAGVDLASLRRAFPQARAVVRLMPNLAAAIGRSASVLMAEGLDDGGRAAVTRLAEDLGTAEWLADEALFDLATALAGSGPAFVYRFIAALTSAAADLGLPQDQAQRLATGMVEGAASLAAASAESPAALAERVASPGGMTRCGLDVLDRDAALAALLREALAATRDRGEALGAAARGAR